MNRSIFPLLLSISILISSVTNANLPSYQTYYSNQEYSQFLQASKELANDLKCTNKEGEDKQHVLNFATIFIAHVLKKHPEYVAQYAQNYPQLSFYEKATFLRGMRSAGIDHDLLASIQDNKLIAIVNDPNLLALSALNDFQIKEAGDLDYLWTSFFATGNEAYMHQIIQTLNKDDEILLTAYEWINRQKISEMLASMGQHRPPNYSHLQKYIDMQAKKRKDYLAQFYISLAALWSLEANAQQDPAIRQVIQKIIKTDPSLDYWKKINSKSFSQQLDLHLDLYWQCMETHNHEQAWHVLEKVVAFADRIKDPSDYEKSNLIEIYREYATHLDERAQLHQSEIYYQKAIAFTDPNTPEYYLLLEDMGINYSKQGKYQEAYDNYTKALEYHEKHHDIARQVQICNLISYTNFKQKNRELSLKYALMAQDNLDVVDDPILQASYLDTIACAYMLNGNYREAEKQIRAAIDLADRYEDPYGPKKSSKYHARLAEILEAQGKTEQAPRAPERS